jgi:hypothetical protein
MSFILKLLGGSAGGWILAGSLVLAATGGAAGGYVARGVIDAPALALANQHTAEAKTETQQCVAQHEKGRAAGAEQVIGELNQASANVAAALADISAKAAQRGKALDQFNKEIANAPPSQACGSSAAELAFRRSVQPQPGAPAP